MAPIRSFLFALALCGCSREPGASEQIRVKGDPAAVSGLPRHRARDRLLIESCCTIQLVSETRSKQLQGIDSIIHAVSGPGYVLQVVFGAYDSAQPQSGYRLAGKRVVDGVELVSYSWSDRSRKAPEGTALWLAQVGGGTINGVNHIPWGLRLMADCDTPAACRALASLVDTIRF